MEIVLLAYSLLNDRQEGADLVSWQVPYCTKAIQKEEILGPHHCLQTCNKLP